MAKPTDDISWATDTDYPAGPETYAGTSTTTEPDSGRKATGWEPGQKPPAQEMNWLQRAWGRWIAWLSALFTDAGHLIELDNIVDSSYNLLERLQPITRHEFPIMMWGLNVAPDDQLVSGDGHDNPAQVSTGIGGAYFRLDAPTGYRLKQVVVRCKGNGVNSFAIGVRQLSTATGPAVVVHEGTNLGGLSATPADQTMNLFAHTDGVSVVVGGSLGVFTYTRTVGSWITDGFEIGQHAEISGFSNGANNLSKKAVTNVSATVLTVDGSLTTPVVETSSAGVFDTVDSSVDNTKNYGLLVNFGATGMGISHLRYTYARIA